MILKYPSQKGCVCTWMTFPTDVSCVNIWYLHRLSYICRKNYHLFLSTNIIYDVTLETAICVIPQKRMNPALQISILNPVNHNLQMSVTNFGSPLITICKAHIEKLDIISGFSIFLRKNIEQYGSTTYLLHTIQMLLYFIQHLTCQNTHLQNICSRHDRTDGSIFASLKNTKKNKC